MMRTKLALASVGIVLGGCLYIVPRTKKQEISRTERQEPVPAEGETLALDARASDQGIQVAASWRRVCEIERHVEVAYRQEKRAGFYVLDWTCSSENCALGLVVGIVFAPATLLISGIVTGLILVGDDPETVVRTEPLPRLTGRCDVPAAGIRLRLQLDGVPAVTGETGDRGRARLALPPAATGTATLHVDDPPNQPPVKVVVPARRSGQ